MKSLVALALLVMMALPLMLNSQKRTVNDHLVEDNHQVICLSNLQAMAVCDAATTPQQNTQQAMVLVRGQLLPLQPANR
jgi:hypothetical protein